MGLSNQNNPSDSVAQAIHNTMTTGLLPVPHQRAAGLLSGAWSIYKSEKGRLQWPIISHIWGFVKL